MMVTMSSTRVLIFAVTFMMIVNSSITFATNTGLDENVNETDNSEDVNSEETDEDEDVDSERTDENEDERELVYAIIIDAGSTSSRVLAVAFERNSSGSLSFVRDLSLTIKPSLSHYAVYPKRAVGSIDTLLERVERFVPKKYWEQTPLVLKATSDLKMLLSADISEEIFNEIRKSFEKNPFKTTENSIGTINSVDEGNHTWFTINFHLGLLIGEFENTATALGLGDCSVEITFMPNSDRHNQEFITDFGMMGRNVNLYSHSYFGTGIMMARESILTRNNGKGSHVIGTRNANIISPCVNEAVKGIEFKYDQDTYYVTGAVSAKTPFIDYQKCKGVVETVVRTFAVLKPKDIHLKKIVAHSNFFHIAENAGLVDDTGGDLTIQSFYKAAEEECAKTYVDGYVLRPFMCLDLIYIAVLLEVGFDFPVDTVISVLQTIDGHEINWALGAANHILKFGIE